jgi:threonine synthase
MQSYLSHLECSLCGAEFPYHTPRFVCESCGGALFVRYDLSKASRTLSPARLKQRGVSLWRFREVLPVQHEENIVTLGESMTPVLHFEKTGRKIGLPRLYVKDESMLPTGSFKSRGMTVAVSKAKEFGAHTVAAPSAGNAGGALAAYAARAGMESVLVVPRDTPEVNIAEIRQYTDNLYLIDGLIHDAGAVIKKGVVESGWYDCSTMKEPCRVEGKKIMGYEVAEQFSWVLPDVIVYPTGGGTGLAGMWKAFEEMETMGWIGEKRPRMIAVQSSGCPPLVRAWRRNAETCEPYNPAWGFQTIASGLRVPKPFADRLLLDILKKSRGSAVEVSDDKIKDAMRYYAREEGLIFCPEGAAAMQAVCGMKERDEINEGESVLVYNTGSGLKYIELLRREE